MLLIRTLSGAGAELVVENLCRGLDTRQFQPSVCELTGRGEKAQALADSGYTVLSLNPFEEPVSVPRMLHRLRRTIVDRGIDLVHSHSTDALASAAVCGRTVAGLRHVHTFHFGNYPRHSPTHLRVERVFHRFPDQLVAVGHRQADEIARTYKIDRSRIPVIWNGVRMRTPRLDHELLEPLRKDGTILIGTIGTLTLQKGHADLLEAVVRLKALGVEARFVVIGDGDLRASLEARSRELGISDRVFFLGWIPDAAERVVPALDVFFQPSKWEAMSMVLLEAAAASLPIVCTNVGESTRVFEDEESALIVAPGDVDAMARALQRLVGDVALRRSLGQAARKRVVEVGGVDRMLRLYEDLYLRLLDRAGPSELR
jgi:glycosyltransferase involved in cell wall biosynthesis